MNREILFRGKRKDNGEWVKGFINYCDFHNAKQEQFREYYIVFQDQYQYEVIPETIGQYTGLTDKNGKKIFEGDILKVPEFLYGEETTCVCIYNQENNAGAIIGFGLYMNNGYFRRYQDLVESDEWDEFEVIGTIYDGDNNE